MVYGAIFTLGNPTSPTSGHFENSVFPDPEQPGN